MTEARKVNLAKESFQRPPINSVKSSEGGGKHQIKHKNKIPKALRYDLENALVGVSPDDVCRNLNDLLVPETAKALSSRQS